MNGDWGDQFPELVALSTVSRFLLGCQGRHVTYYVLDSQTGSATLAQLLVGIRLKFSLAFTEVP